MDVSAFLIKEYEHWVLYLHQDQCLLGRLFQYDLMNYASLGNVFRHLHVHLVPRYQTRRTFHGREFTDVRWGQHYEPHECPPGGIEAGLFSAAPGVAGCGVDVTPVRGYLQAR